MISTGVGPLVRPELGILADQRGQAAVRTAGLSA
jgi:hypothetical protein